MVRCPRCDVRMEHTRGDPSEGFWFKCPKCRRRIAKKKFPDGTYIGSPLTPMGFDYREPR